MAKIMVIAGGEWQCPIVQTAKSMGHTVICSNLYEDSPAFAYADVGEVADVLDREKNLWIAKKYKPDAVLTDQSDIAVPTVAYVAEQMHLKGIGEEKAELFTNKYKMREFCEKHGFPSPVCYHCTDYREAEEALKKLGRAIIKPLDSQSSRGIYIIDSPEQLKEVFEKSMSYSNNEKAVLVEQYIEGTEFTVDGVKTASGYQVTAISRKNHFSYNPNVANELLFSWKDADYDYKELEELNKIINLAKETLEESYDEIKKNITPKFTKELSNNIEMISDGKYIKANFNSDTGLTIEAENGEYIECNKLSIGTIDQLYLSLRLSATKEITKETIPIILDESFAYFDNQRLENVIKYLDSNYNNQIIIFTCTNREKEILDKLNIEYNLVNL